MKELIIERLSENFLLHPNNETSTGQKIFILLFISQQTTVKLSEIF